MRVFINGRFLTQRTTGVQRYALETLLAMDEVLSREGASGLDFVLLAPEGATPPRLQAIAFQRIGPFSGHAWEQLTLPRATQGSWLLSFGPTGPVLKRDQIVTIHDAAVHAVPAAFSRSFRAWYRLLLPTLIRRTPRVMTVSEFSRRELVARFGAVAERVRVSPEGWQHITRFSPDTSVLERNGVRSRGYVLAVSSMAPHKNFKLVAEALRQLGDSGFEVVVAGKVDPQIFGNVDQAALANLKLLGHVSDEQLVALYQNAAAFVYPSLYEGFGIPPLEAMALDCPVLASDAASIPEVCGDAALYFSPHDAAALAALMRRVVTEPETRQRAIEKGRQQIQLYSWEAAARCHLALVDEVVRSDSAAPKRQARERLAAAANA